MYPALHKRLLEFIIIIILLNTTKALNSYFFFLLDSDVITTLLRNNMFLLIDNSITDLFTQTNNKVMPERKIKQQRGYYKDMHTDETPPHIRQM